MKRRPKTKREHGFTVMEVVAIVVMLIFMLGIAAPSIMTAVYNVRLRGGAADLSGLMQQTRITAARQNALQLLRFTTVGGRQVAYIDLNNNNTYDSTEPEVMFNGSVVPAAGAPNGSNGQPTAYVLVGDTSNGTPYDNATVLGFSSRGLPCAYDTTTTPPTCATPSTTYFVYYLTDTRMGNPGWAGVVVTKSGRTRVVMWDGASWH